MFSLLSACSSTNNVTADGSGDDQIGMYKKLQLAREELRLKSVEQLRKEIAKEDAEPTDFVIYLSDSDEEELEGEDVLNDLNEEASSASNSIEVVDSGEELQPRRWENEQVRSWGKTDDFLLAVDIGQDSRVDKEGDNKILQLYEFKVAEWKQNNPGRKLPSRISEQFHTSAIVEQSINTGGRGSRSTRNARSRPGFLAFNCQIIDHSYRVV